jgi:hypothetical protein
MGPLEMELLATIGNALVYPGDFDLCLFSSCEALSVFSPPWVAAFSAGLAGL